MKKGLLYSSIVLTTLCFASGVYFYRLSSEKSAHQKQSIPIQIIAQTGPEKEALKTDYLAELLGLSCDVPTQVINKEKANKDLLKSPVIKKGVVKQISPSILSIDYSLRKPYVFLGDYENIALDQSGCPFPFFPFYTPKNMPLLYLGVKNITWNEPVEKRKLAFEVLEFVSKELGFTTIHSLNVTQAEHPSLGQREIILVIDQESGRHFLRLTPLTYRDELRRYILLECESGDLIIDLRLTKLAFIKEVSHALESKGGF